MSCGVAIAITGALSFALDRALADGPPTIEPLVYAGTLIDGSTPVEGSRSIGIVLWSSATASTASDRACATAPAAMPVTAGRFRVVLDATCSAAVHARPDLWVELSVDGTVMPRTHLGAVPYALEAASAGSASGALAQQVVPSGMIAMFAGACPAGWSEYMPLRGRFPRGEPTGSIASLGMGGTDDAVAVAHTHTITGTATGGDHTHTMSLTTSAVGDHTHAEFVTANPGACPGNGPMRTDYTGDSSDDCSYPQGATTGAAGGHSHTITGSTAGAVHTHPLTGTTSMDGVAGVGMNLPSYAEVLFCRRL